MTRARATNAVAQSVGDPSLPLRAASPDLEQDGIWVHLSSYDWHEILGKAWTVEIQDRIRDQVRVAAQSELVLERNARKPITLAEGKRKGKTG